MKIKNAPFILLTAIATLSFACNNQPTCIPEHSNLLEIAFVDKLGASKEILLVSADAASANESYSIVQDSIVSKLSIPLSSLDSSIFLTINSDTAIIDITLSYKALSILIAPECGIETKFDFIKLEDTNFNNVIVINQTLNKDIKTNVEITH